MLNNSISNSGNDDNHTPSQSDTELEIKESGDKIEESLKSLQECWSEETKYAVDFSTLFSLYSSNSELELFSQRTKEILEIVQKESERSGLVNYNNFGKAIETLEPVRLMSIFYYYNDNGVIVNGINPLHFVIMLISILVLLIFGFIIFNRRDLKN